MSYIVSIWFKFTFSPFLFTMAPTYSKLAKGSKHSNACKIACVSCYRRVPCDRVGFGNNREYVPTSKGSVPVTEHLANLALLRWEVIWDYTQISSAALTPMRLCVSCRLALMHSEPPKRKTGKLNTSRLHSSTTEWKRGECSVCDNAFAFGKRQNDANKTTGALSSFVTICKKCLGETAKSRPHKCVSSEAVKNAKKLAFESKTTVGRLCSELLKHEASGAGDIYLPTAGKPLHVHIGKPEKQVLKISSDDMLRQQSCYSFSSRANAKCIRQWRDRLQTDQVDVQMPSQKSVDELRKARTEDLFAEITIDGNPGTEANPKRKRINVVTCTDVFELGRRVNRSRGELFRAVKIQGDHGQGSLKISAQFTQSNSVNELQLLSVTQESNESIDTLKEMFTRLNLQRLADFGISIILAGDLKFIQLVMGLMNGYTCYPCPWCNWRMTGPQRDPVDAICHDRDIERDMDTFQKLGSSREHSRRCHGQQAPPCLPLHLLNDPASRISPCTLHIALGLVNALDKSMTTKAGEGEMEAWYAAAKVTKSPYQGGTFEGNECRRLVRAACSSAWSGEHPLTPYLPLFEAFERLYEIVFPSRCDLTDDDLLVIMTCVQEFVDLWSSLSFQLGLTAPLKLHVLSVHVPQFCVQHRCTPALFGEQDGEMAHRRFLALLNTFRPMGSRALLHTVKVWNACRF